MRRYLLALACILSLATPAAAQSCAPVEAEPFIAEGVAAFASGKYKGIVAQSGGAAAFGREGGFPHEVIAVFLIEGDEPYMVLVMQGPDGGIACAGQPTAQAIAILKRIVGQDA